MQWLTSTDIQIIVTNLKMKTLYVDYDYSFNYKFPSNMILNSKQFSQPFVQVS